MSVCEWCCGVGAVVFVAKIATKFNIRNSFSPSLINKWSKLQFSPLKQLSFHCLGDRISDFQPFFSVAESSAGNKKESRAAGSGTTFDV